MDPRPTTEETDPPTDWMNQKIAGRYRILRLIARGGMAVVYEAEDTQLGRSVALKILAPPSVEGGDFEARFRQEAQALATLQHPNIVTIHDYGSTEDGRWFLAMEYIRGPRLSDMMKDGPLEPIRALWLIQQICLALRYAHKRGIIHRDLKPSNLLIQEDEDGGGEVVKVVDFGLVKIQENDQQLTQAGLVMGSPHFMSPEQVQGIETDARTDIYAVGILLFRSITGSFPFHGENSTGTMLAHLHRPIPEFGVVAPQIIVPEGLEAIVRRCLAKKPEERYQDMTTLFEALSACSGGAQMQSASMMRPRSFKETPAPAPKRNLLAVGLAAALVGMGFLVILLGVGWYLSQNSSPAPVQIDVPVVAPAPAPTPVPAPTPAPAPVPAPAPAPPKTAKPQAEPPQKKPVPPKTPEKGTAPAPEGYMPLPDDFN